MNLRSWANRCISTFKVKGSHGRLDDPCATLTDSFKGVFYVELGHITTKDGRAFINRSIHTCIVTGAFAMELGTEYL